MTGIELIAQERDEQIKKHCRTIANDIIVNSKYQLLDAAICLLQKHAEGRVLNENKHPIEAADDSLDWVFRDFVPTDWNEEIWYNMFDKPYKDRLVIAGALIAAEIDRIININQ